MRTLLSVRRHALLILIVLYPDPSFDRSFQSLSGGDSPAAQQRSGTLQTVALRDEPRIEPSKNSQDSEDRTAREIQRFTEPTIRLRGTAEEIGLDGSVLVSILGKQFLKDFAFLQSDFTFDKTYETWEIGLFECEAWTVGSRYPIALHVQCVGGSMDAPRHWHSASLGYGPKDKITDMVRKTLETIVTDFSTYVRTAHGKNES